MSEEEEPKIKTGDRRALLVEEVVFYTNECCVLQPVGEDHDGALFISYYETVRDLEHDFPKGSLVVVQATGQYEHFGDRMVLKRYGSEKQRMWKLAKRGKLYVRKERN